MIAVRLSRRSVGLSDTVCDVLGERDRELIVKLLKSDDDASGDPHAVGLRMVHYYFLVVAPLYWWKQMDRYRIGKEQASDSTMYNLMRKPLAQQDFEGGISNMHLQRLNVLINNGDFDAANRNLPHSYLQTRQLCISFVTLRRILAQRKNHKLTEWQMFCQQVLAHADYPELLS